MGVDRSPTTSNSTHQVKTRSSSKAEICRICKREGNQEEIKVVCNGCNQLHHLSCAGITSNFYQYYILNKKINWHCYLCDNETRTENLQSINRMNQLVKEFNSEIQKINFQNHTWKQEIEIKLTEKIEIEVAKQTKELQNVTQNSQNNRLLRRKNLIVSGVPHNENEDTECIIKNIAKVILFKDGFWLDNCFRLSNKEKKSNERSQNILVKFTTELLRDKFMKAYLEFIKNNALTPDEIGLEGNYRIFINEHLCENIYNLMREALKLKKDGKVFKVHAHASHLMVNSSQGWTKIITANQLEDLKGIILRK